MAQFLTVYSFRTPKTNFMKLHTVSFQNAVNQFVNFQRRLTIIVEISHFENFMSKDPFLWIQDHQKCIWSQSACCTRVLIL